MIDAKLDVRDVFGNPIDAEVKIRTKGKGAGKHRVVTVTAPGYERESVILDFAGRAHVVMLMKSEACECVTNRGGRLVPVDVMMLLTHTAAEHLGLGRLFEDGFDPAKATTDRTYWHVAARRVERIRHSGVWSPDKNRGQGHSYEDGWKVVASYRSNTHIVSMQAVVHERHQVFNKPKRLSQRREAVSRTEHILELDLDMAGFAHLGQVLGNWITGGETDPVLMAQRCAYFWGLRLPFEMRVR